jgi:hypothetical protein
MKNLLVVSYFYQKKHREPWLKEQGIIKECPEITETIDEFVWHDIYGIKSVVTFFNLWAEEDVQILMYEKLHKMPNAQTFKERTEIEGQYDKNKPEERNARRGKIGGYKDELKKGTIQELNKFIKEILHKRYESYYV